jgi:hypothetical protein
MNTQDISKATDPDLRASMAAMQRAALLARQTAIQTETHIVIVEGEALIRVSADELRRIAGEGKPIDYTQWRQDMDTDESVEDISRKAMTLRNKT